ncbi:putative L-type lectin-domain containing receptor kinase S.5 [Citrus sinensis]|uniref:probable L-type lectin-domain containing receptor kinase S.5 n=1 Tax=Citrus sinensis TaxID=2711 RepID=UPI0003D71176|nr:probable L-type lectin-domain containing receptor kinase S.5 [Citrus sinensis]KAH9673959.1 putative L-type lectin-domain containing receptor kinase S.5 [Citrus sinensis]
MCFSLMAKFLILAILMGSAAHIQVSSLHFNFQSFTEQNRNELSFDNSTVAKSAIQVTYDVRGAPITNQSGRAIYKDQFQLWRDNKNVKATFSTTFVLNILNQTAQPGEGLAFVIAGNKDLPENSEGQWLGIVNGITNGTNQSQIVAIEFDTKKSYEQDINDNHVGLDVNSVYSIRQVPLTRVNLANGTDIKVQVRYDGQNITVFVANMETPLLSEPIDLSEYLPEKVFVGFSASTGDDTQLNCVKSWAFDGSDIGGDSKAFRVLIAVLVPAVVLLAGVAFYCWRRYRARELDDDIEGLINGTNLAPKKFRLKELKKATGNFNPKNKLGKGGFGTVYKGIWRNKEIAVKRVSETSRQGKQEFIAEVTTIGSLRHRNLVKLIGWCYERHDFLLVYEYMPNGSLDKFIFYDETNSGPGEVTLNWEKRLSVIHGTSQALDYLHNGSEKRVLHRDIKSSNIMLDSEFNARLGDFGLARTIQENLKTHHSTKEIAGTPGYMAPESFLVGRATIETDIYAFGVLILEVACGRKPGNQSEQNSYNNSIVHWLWELRRKGRILDAADSRLGGEFSEKEMECVLILGLACCHPNPHLRPSMKTVLQVLSGEANPPVLPAERPSFVWPAMPPSFVESDYTHTGSQLDPFSDLTGR